MRRGFFPLVIAGFCAIAEVSLAQPSSADRPQQHVTITVHEGTSMQVAVSPRTSVGKHVRLIC